LNDKVPLEAEERATKGKALELGGIKFHQWAMVMSFSHQVCYNMTEQQIVPIFGLKKSLQQEEKALTQGLKQLH
jgi:hypothetical protein